MSDYTDSEQGQYDLQADQHSDEQARQMSGQSEMPTCNFLRSKPTQIQAVSQPGDYNSGPHVQLFALCNDGSIWVQYQSSGYSNVPTDGLWRMIQPPQGWEYTK